MTEEEWEKFASAGKKSGTFFSSTIKPSNVVGEEGEVEVTLKSRQNPSEGLCYGELVFIDPSGFKVDPGGVVVFRVTIEPIGIILSSH